MQKNLDILISYKKNREDLIGVVLIGGKSIRMGTPKACIEIEGEKLAIRTSKLLEKFSKKVYLSGRKDQFELIKEAPYPFIADNYEDIGPLAGVLSAFETISHTDPLLIVATDMPLIDEITIKELVDNRDLSKVATMFVHEESGFLEPLCAIYEPTAFNILNTYHLKGIYGFHRIFKREQLNLIPVKAMRPLTNINYPDQLDKL